MNKGKYYITTAIAYTSGKPHIGNTYEIILADAIARYKRAEGYDVWFQTGTDEHGQKIQEKAEAIGIEPQAFVDENCCFYIVDATDLKSLKSASFIVVGDVVSVLHHNLVTDSL